MNLIKKFSYCIYFATLFFLLKNPFLVNAQESNIKLIEELNYGQENLLIDDSLEAGGGVLSNITGIEVDTESLYVLDSDFKKIAVFDKSSGELKKNIMGGFGRGPGEFSLPIAISINPENQIVVYDYENAKLSYFNRKGENITEKTVSVASRSITFTEEDIWIGGMNSNDYYLFSLQNDSRAKLAKNMDGHIKVSKEDLEYTSRGVISFIDHINFEKIVVASHRPSIWYMIDDGNVTEYGSEMFPESKAVRGSDGIRRIENHTASICHLNSDYIAILWLHRPKEEQQFIALDVYTTNGNFVGRNKMDMELLHTNMTCDRNENNIYLSSPKPYPRVVKYEVSIED